LLFTVTSTFLFLHNHTTFLQTSNLLHISTVKLLYTVKEKGDNIDRKPYPLSYGLINPYRNSHDYAQNPQRNCKLMNRLLKKSLKSAPTPSLPEKTRIEEIEIAIMAVLAIWEDAWRGFEPIPKTAKKEGLRFLSFFKYLCFHMLNVNSNVFHLRNSFTCGSDNPFINIYKFNSVIEIIEFGEWAKTTGEPFPAQTWETLGSGIIADSAGGVFRQEKTKIPVPESFRNLQREKSWVSGRPLAGSSRSLLSLKQVLSEP
jgi:hypothetical protein